MTEKFFMAVFPHQEQFDSLYRRTPGTIMIHYNTFADEDVAGFSRAEKSQLSNRRRGSKSKISAYAAIIP